MLLSGFRAQQHILLQRGQQLDCKIKLIGDVMGGIWIAQDQVIQGHIKVDRHINKQFNGRTVDATLYIAEMHRGNGEDLAHPGLRNFGLSAQGLDSLPTRSHVVMHNCSSWFLKCGWDFKNREESGNSIWLTPPCSPP